MRIPLALCAMLALASCQTTGTGARSTGQLAGTVADISTNIGLACSAADQLLALPGTQAGITAGLGKITSSAAKLSDRVAAYCALGRLAGPLLATALGELDTRGAVLLGTGVANK